MEKTEKLSSQLTFDLATWLRHTETDIKFNPDIENPESRKVHLRFYEPDENEDWIIKNEGFFVELMKELDGEFSEVSEIKLTPAIYPPFGLMDEEEEKSMNFKHRNCFVRGVFVRGTLKK